jgi:hypothetical protein
MLEFHLVDELLLPVQLEFHLSGLLPPALTEILVTATEENVVAAEIFPYYQQGKS